MSEVPLYSLDGGHLSNEKQFRGGLVFEAHRLVYYSNLGLRVIKKKKVPSRHLTDFIPDFGYALEP